MSIAGLRERAQTVMNLQPQRRTHADVEQLDKQFDSLQINFMLHFRRSVAVHAQMKAYLEAIRRIATTSSELGDAISVYYHTNAHSGEVASGVFKSALTKIDTQARAGMDAKFMDEVFSLWSQYIALLQRIRTEILSRAPLHDKYVHYLFKVEHIMETGKAATDLHKRNVAKLGRSKALFLECHEKSMHAMTDICNNSESVLNTSLENMIKCTRLFFSTANTVTSELETVRVGALQAAKNDSKERIAGLLKEFNVTQVDTARAWRETPNPHDSGLFAIDHQQQQATRMSLSFFARKSTRPSNPPESQTHHNASSPNNLEDFPSASQPSRVATHGTYLPQSTNPHTRTNLGANTNAIDPRHESISSSAVSATTSASSATTASSTSANKRFEGGPRVSPSISRPAAQSSPKPATAAIPAPTATRAASQSATAAPNPQKQFPSTQQAAVPLLPSAPPPQRAPSPTAQQVAPPPLPSAPLPIRVPPVPARRPPLPSHPPPRPATPTQQTVTAAPGSPLTRSQVAAIASQLNSVPSTSSPQAALNSSPNRRPTNAQPPSIPRMLLSSSNSSNNLNASPPSPAAASVSAPRTLAMRVRACYSYRAQCSDELSFDEGDLFSVLVQDGDWWDVELLKQGSTKRGLVPSNYVSQV